MLCNNLSFKIFYESVNPIYHCGCNEKVCLTIIIARNTDVYLNELTETDLHTR